MFIVSRNMVRVKQNRFPRNQGGGGGWKEAQKGAETIFKYIFSLSTETHSSPRWPSVVFHSFVREARGHLSAKPAPASPMASTSWTAQPQEEVPHVAGLFGGTAIGL